MPPTPFALLPYSPRDNDDDPLETAAANTPATESSWCANGMRRKTEREDTHRNSTHLEPRRRSGTRTHRWRNGTGSLGFMRTHSGRRWHLHVAKTFVNETITPSKTDVNSVSSTDLSRRRRMRSPERSRRRSSSLSRHGWRVQRIPTPHNRAIERSPLSQITRPHGRGVPNQIARVPVFRRNVFQ